LENVSQAKEEAEEGGNTIFDECIVPWDEGEGEEGEKVFSLYLVMRRIFLASLLSTFSSTPPSSTFSSTSSSSSRTSSSSSFSSFPSFSSLPLSTPSPNHLLPIASKMIGRAGVVGLKEIEGNVWTSLTNFNLCEWYLEDVATRTGKWFLPPSIIPLRSVSFPKLVSTLLPIGKENCWVTFQSTSLPSIYSFNLGLIGGGKGGGKEVMNFKGEKRKEEGGPVVRNIISLFLLFSKMEQETWSLQSTNTKTDSALEPPLTNQWWVVSVGEEGGVWVWNMKEERKEEMMCFGYNGTSKNFSGDLVASFMLKLPWKIKHVCVDFNEFWIAGNKGSEMCNISLIWRGPYSPPQLLVEKFSPNQKIGEIGGFCIVNEKLLVSSLNQETKVFCFPKQFQRAINPKENLQNPIRFHPPVSSFEQDE